VVPSTAATDEEMGWERTGKDDDRYGITIVMMYGDEPRGHVDSGCSWRAVPAGVLLVGDTGAYLPRLDELNWHDGAVDKTEG